MDKLTPKQIVLKTYPFAWADKHNGKWWIRTGKTELNERKDAFGHTIYCGDTLKQAWKNAANSLTQNTNSNGE